MQNFKMGRTFFKLKNNDVKMFHSCTMKHLTPTIQVYDRELGLSNLNTSLVSKCFDLYSNEVDNSFKHFIKYINTEVEDFNVARYIIAHINEDMYTIGMLSEEFTAIEDSMGTLLNDLRKRNDSISLYTSYAFEVFYLQRCVHEVFSEEWLTKGQRFNSFNIETAAVEIDFKF